MAAGGMRIGHKSAGTLPAKVASIARPVAVAKASREWTKREVNKTESPANRIALVSTKSNWPP